MAVSVTKRDIKKFFTQSVFYAFLGGAVSPASYPLFNATSKHAPLKGGNRMEINPDCKL